MTVPGEPFLIVNCNRCRPLRRPYPSHMSDVPCSNPDPDPEGYVFSHLERCEPVPGRVYYRPVYVSKGA